MRVAACWCVVWYVATAGAVQARPSVTLVTREEPGDGRWRFAVEVERLHRADAPDMLEFTVTATLLKPKENPHLSRTASLDVRDGKLQVSAARLEPKAADDRLTYTFRVAETLASNSRFSFRETGWPPLLSNSPFHEKSKAACTERSADYWFYLAEFIRPVAPAPKAVNPKNPPKPTAEKIAERERPALDGTGGAGCGPVRAAATFTCESAIVAVSRDDGKKEPTLSVALVALTTYERVTREQYSAYPRKPGATGKVVLAGGKEYTWNIEPNYAATVTDADGGTVYLLHPRLKDRPSDAALAEIARRLRGESFPERTAALEALAKLLPTNAPDGTEFDPVIEPLFQIAGWGGNASHNAELAEALLVRIGVPAIPVLRAKLKSPDAHDRRVAVQLMVRVGPVNAELVCRIQPLLKDTDHFVRAAAIEGLAATGALAKGAVEDLETVATGDPHPARRVGARSALVRIAGASSDRVRALAALVELEETEERAAAYAASAIEGLGRDGIAAEPQLRVALGDARSAVRVYAASALGAIGAADPETITALIGLLQDDPETECRRSAAASLGQIGPKAHAAIPALGKALATGEKRWWVAAKSLGEIGSVDAVVPLVAALASKDADLRRAAIQAMGHLGPVAASAAGSLENVSRDDTSLGNRAAAGTALRAITGRAAKTP